MTRPTMSLRAALMATAIVAGAPAGARAQTADAQRMNAIEAQIRNLQTELRSMRQDLAARDAQVRAARQDAAQARAAVRAAPPPQPASAQAVNLQPPAAQPAGGQQGGQVTAGQQNNSTTPSATPNGSFRLGGVTVTLGGFIEGASVYRTRNEVSDISSNFNTAIPFNYQPQYHQGEFRETARQSRISLLAQGDVSPTSSLAAYFETDFQGGSPTANSNESNSYTLRIRNAYGTYDDSASGLHILGGQNWSLATLQGSGITPRKEDIPLTIDAQYVVGFNWTRQPQVRIVGDFDNHRLWAGLSLEMPQNVTYVGPNGAGTLNGTANFQNPGNGLLASTVNYSDDIAPDVIAKIAYEPGFGHFEAFGIARFLHDRVSQVGNGHNNTTLAGGGGLGASIPLLNNRLVLRGTVLAGYGLGRYASGQLPDSTLSQTGSPVPIPTISALFGVVGHPVPSVDVYGYVGTEQARRTAFAESGKGYGYGSPLYNNAGCYNELNPLGASGCTANTSGLVEGTVGAWWRVLHGQYGTGQIGAQYAYVRRDIFSGQGPTNAKGNRGTDDNIVFVSLRYLPFQ